MAKRFPIVKSFEEDIVPAVSDTASILLVARLRYKLPESTFNAPTLNLLFKDAVNLLPPPKVKVLLEMLLFTTTELLKILIAILPAKLPDTVIVLGVLIVNEPTARSLPAKSMEVKPDPERSRLGVAVVLIELDKVKLPVMVKVCPATLNQFAVLLDIKDRLDIVEVLKVTLAPPLLVTYTFGLDPDPRFAVISPTPSPPK